MEGFRHLLLATDFSTTSGQAVERAALLTGKSGVSLDLIHVQRPALADRIRQFTDEASVDTEQELLDEARHALDSQAAGVRERYGVSAGTHLTSGSLIRELVSRAETQAVDLVVLGFCGAGLMRHFLIGSTAERLLTRAPCPILVVKTVAERQYHSLLVSVDFSAMSLPTFACARMIARDAEMSLLNVFEASFGGKLRHAGVDSETIDHYRTVAHQEALQKLSKLCREAGFVGQEPGRLAVHGDPAHRIVTQAMLRGCDLIVVGKHSENMFENLLLGSVTRTVIAQSRCDFATGPAVVAWMEVVERWRVGGGNRRCERSNPRLRFSTPSRVSGEMVSQGYAIRGPVACQGQVLVDEDQLGRDDGVAAPRCPEDCLIPLLLTVMTGTERCQVNRFVTTF